MTMTTLREARAGKMDAFLKEHKNDPPGDLDKLEAAIRAPLGQGTDEATRQSSSRDASDD